MPFSTLLALLATCAIAGAVDVLQLPLAISPPSSSSDAVPNDFQSFSIELAFWADYAGNHSHPNTFSNRLFANLREFNGGVPQILRIGGNTQDHATYVPDQNEGIINNWDYTRNADQPQNSTIGPAFWESYNAITGTKYIPGLNFYKEDAGYLVNLHGETQESLKYIPAERLHLLELGNENDNGARSGFRPTNWTQEDYVEEWILRTKSIQTPNKSLRFFAPSFCCFNITTSYSFFSPWTVWNSTFGYDRDGWIDEVSQHGYISSTGNNPKLQGTLMNHTNLVNTVKPHIELNIFHRQNGRKYIVGETNSISGQGAHGVSDVFGSALWLVDYCLYLASQSIARLHLHQGTSYRYAAWLPIVVNGTGPLVKPPYYGHIFVEKFLGPSKTTQIDNIDLNSDYYSAYAAYESGTLSRVAILNLLAWDPPNSTDASTSPGATVDRPAATFNLASPQGYKSATVELLTAPGATSDANITVAGISYDYALAQGRGVRVGKDVVTTLQPGEYGSFSVDVEASQAVIVTFHR